MQFSKPGDLIQASRNPKMKRAVMKAIGMPMRKKRKMAPMMTRTMQTKPSLGNSQSAPRPVTSSMGAYKPPMMSGIANSTPMTAGPLKKRATRKKRKAIKMSGSFQGKSNALGQGGRAAQLKARGVPGGVIGNLARAAHAAPGQANYHKRKATKRKGSQGLVPSPAANAMMRSKRKASKRKSSGTSFGDEKTQGMASERSEEGAKGFKKKRKAPHAYKNLGKFAHKKKASPKG